MQKSTRYGYRERSWVTLEGSYFSPLIEPRTTAGGLAAVFQEANVQGMSTHSADESDKAMDMSGISKSQEARLCREVGEQVGGFLF